MQIAVRNTWVSNDKGIQLSQQDLNALKRASVVAEKARELARTLDPDFEDHWLDLELAGVEHFATQYLPDDGFLPIVELPMFA